MADDRLIPSSIKDDSAQAYNLLAERLGAIDYSPVLVYFIDHVRPEILPYLAEQFNVAGARGWRMATTDAGRRALLKNARRLHRYKGTYYAIESAIESLGLSCLILRCWEYAAQPFHFRVVIDLLDSGITAEQQELLSTYISVFKSLRDVQDPLQLNLSVTGSLTVGVSLQSSEIVTVYPAAPEPLSGTLVFTTSDPTPFANGWLAVTVSHAKGAVQMQFSHDGVFFFGWEPFAASRYVTLPFIGPNTLTGRFKDAAGNVSAPVSATITRY